MLSFTASQHETETKELSFISFKHSAIFKALLSHFFHSFALLFQFQEQKEIHFRMLDLKCLNLRCKKHKAFLARINFLKVLTVFHVVCYYLVTILKHSVNTGRLKSWFFLGNWCITREKALSEDLIQPIMHIVNKLRNHHYLKYLGRYKSIWRKKWDAPKLPDR